MGSIVIFFNIVRKAKVCFWKEKFSSCVLFFTNKQKLNIQTFMKNRWTFLKLPIYYWFDDCWLEILNLGNYKDVQDSELFQTFLIFARFEAIWILAKFHFLTFLKNLNLLLAHSSFNQIITKFVQICCECIQGRITKNHL